MPSTHARRGKYLAHCEDLFPQIEHYDSEETYRWLELRSQHPSGPAFAKALLKANKVKHLDLDKVCPPQMGILCVGIDTAKWEYSVLELTPSDGNICNSTAPGINIGLLCKYFQ